MSQTSDKIESLKNVFLGTFLVDAFNFKHLPNNQIGH